MDDGCGQSLRHVRGQPLPDVDDLGQVSRLVHLPELREPAHLALVVVPGSQERGQTGGVDVRGVDLHERVNEVVPFPCTGKLCRRDEKDDLRRLGIWFVKMECDAGGFRLSGNDLGPFVEQQPALRLCPVEVFRVNRSVKQKLAF